METKQYDDARAIRSQHRTYSLAEFKANAPVGQDSGLVSFPADLTAKPVFNPDNDLAGFWCEGKTLLGRSEKLGTSKRRYSEPVVTMPNDYTFDALCEGFFLPIRSSGDSLFLKGDSFDTSFVLEHTTPANMLAMNGDRKLLAKRNAQLQALSSAALAALASEVQAILDVAEAAAQAEASADSEM
jgi:hypothetical protein